MNASRAAFLVACLAFVSSALVAAVARTPTSTALRVATFNIEFYPKS